VQVVHSGECDRYTMRVTWKEQWKDYSVIVFDYSAVKGPVCIVPVSVFFNSDFVNKKRKMKSYANSGYWWSQIFAVDHELPSLIMKYRNRWDII